MQQTSCYCSEGREGKTVTESERKKFPDLCSREAKRHGHHAVLGCEQFYHPKNSAESIALQQPQYSGELKLRFLVVYMYIYALHMEGQYVLALSDVYPSKISGLQFRSEIEQDYYYFLINLYSAILCSLQIHWVHVVCLMILNVWL